MIVQIGLGFMGILTLIALFTDATKPDHYGGTGITKRKIFVVHHTDDYGKRKYSSEVDIPYFFWILALAPFGIAAIVAAITGVETNSPQALAIMLSTLWLPLVLWIGSKL
jgi:hypothetical protein